MLKRSTLLLAFTLVGLLSPATWAQHGDHATPTPGTGTCPMGMTCPAEGTGTAATPAPNPAHQAQMAQYVQDVLTMQQNTAAWGPGGLYVLQGNRLLRYNQDLALLSQVTLPLPAAPLVTPAPGTSVPLRSMLTTRLLPTDRGVLVIRGQQVIRLDDNLRVLAQTTLPAVPALTQAELNAVCPLCTSLPPAATTMPGTTGTMQGSIGPAVTGDLPTVGATLDLTPRCPSS